MPPGRSRNADLRRDRFEQLVEAGRAGRLDVARTEHVHGGMSPTTEPRGGLAGDDDLILVRRNSCRRCGWLGLTRLSRLRGSSAIGA